jgi:nucleotide-binding universal stress UspA family protein
MSGEALDLIVVGHDGSSGADLAVRWAGGIAAVAEAEVVVVRGYNPLDDLGTVDPPVELAELERRARERLETEGCASLRELGVRHRAVLVEDHAVPAIVDTARSEGADLVVVGSHGQTGWRERILGSVATKLPHELTCPVAIVPLPRPS